MNSSLELVVAASFTSGRGCRVIGPCSRMCISSSYRASLYRSISKTSTAGCACRSCCCCSTCDVSIMFPEPVASACSLIVMRVSAAAEIGATASLAFWHV
eukprot:3186-Heterococcus_DN1.PRE.1